MKRKREDGTEVQWVPGGLSQDPGAGGSRSRSRSRSHGRSRSRSRSSSPYPGAGSPGPSGQPDRSQLPSSTSLFNLSLLKLHYGLRQVEPNLRHIVLVVNTLRRVQSSMDMAATSETPPEAPRAAPQQPATPAMPTTPPGSPRPRRRANRPQTSRSWRGLLFRSSTDSSEKGGAPDGTGTQ